MARTTRTAQSIVLAGLTPVYTAADNVNGEQCLFQGKDIILQVKNIGGSPTTVTITAPGKFKGLSLTAPTVTVVATTGDKMILIKCSEALMNTDGMVYVDYSVGTSVTAAYLQHE